MCTQTQYISHYLSDRRGETNRFGASREGEVREGERWRPNNDHGDDDNIKDSSNCCKSSEYETKPKRK